MSDSGYFFIVCRNGQLTYWDVPIELGGNNHVEASLSLFTQITAE